MATFADVVRLTSDLPGVTVGTAYGTPALRTSRASFCRLWSDREHDRDDVHDTAVLVLMAPLELKRQLLQAHPDVLFSTPHYEGHGAYLCRLDDVDEELLVDLLEHAWQEKASTSERRAIDGS